MTIRTCESNIAGVVNSLERSNLSIEDWMLQVCFIARWLPPLIEDTINGRERGTCWTRAST
ncbi:MAG: hypothetical protein F6K18_05800 [Okeania sp. SIO2C2]|uniref:hypothetical protein n=1 Tax=Okeania sp. SIO2C2 TaxID=2607787 RepID=UPI0013BBE03C|nr:hypothetical protein [Okeania sp. SIO2C2]NEP86373.1 hypothetical protein [Okeania sp. SIO2C2]